MSTRLEFAQKLKASGANADQIKKAFDLYRQNNGSFKDDQDESSPPKNAGGLIDHLFPGTIADAKAGRDTWRDYGPQQAVDALSYPTRAAAAFTGQDINDPNAYALRPLVEKMKMDTTGEGVLPDDPPTKFMRRQELSRSVKPSDINQTVEAIGRMVSDPVVAGGLVSHLLKDALSATGKKIVMSTLKPGYAGAKAGFDINNLMDKYNLGGSMKEMGEKTTAALNNYGGQIRDIETANKNLPFPMYDQISDIDKDLGSQIQNEGKHSLIANQLHDAGTDHLKAALEFMTPGTGESNFQQALNFKRDLQNRAAAAGAYSDPALRATTKAENAEVLRNTMMADAIKRKTEAMVPEIADANKAYSEIKPIAAVLARRGVINAQNHAIGLGDIVALSEAMEPAAEPQGLLSALLYKAQRMPSVGNKLNQVSKLIPVKNMQNASIAALANKANPAALFPDDGQQ